MGLIVFFAAMLAGLIWHARKERRFRHWREEHPNWWRDPVIEARRRSWPTWWMHL